MNFLMSTCSCGLCDPEEVFSCRKYDLILIFKCEDEYDVHERLQHFRVCDECLTLFFAGTKFNNHIIQVHKFQCNTCGVKFIEESELKNPNVWQTK